MSTNPSQVFPYVSQTQNQRASMTTWVQTLYFLNDSTDGGRGRSDALQGLYVFLSVSLPTLAEIDVRRSTKCAVKTQSISVLTQCLKDPRKDVSFSLFEVEAYERILHLSNPRHCFSKVWTAGLIKHNISGLLIRFPTNIWIKNGTHWNLADNLRSAKMASLMPEMVVDITFSVKKFNQSWTLFRKAFDTGHSPSSIRRALKEKS